ncbi:MAG TPA: NUDIX hydrolase [Candidatus Nanoarchaeia archaeon]|nr:NUDIX hydrolase [Candidatus Nanoarchaeia archaeon]
MRNNKIKQREGDQRCPYIATDIIIEYNDGKKHGLVLITRKNPPYGLALPGGFAEYGLSLEENAVKEVKEETGLDAIILNPEQPLCVHSSPGRDPRAHVISSTYIAKGSGSLKGGDDAKSAELYSIDEVINLIEKNKLVFDHAKALKKYLIFKGLYQGLGEQSKERKA